MSAHAIGKYRRLQVRLWRHPGFTDLRETAKILALYILTGPQSNRIGLFNFSIASASEDLNVGVETLRKGLPDVSGTFGWLYDADARVMYIPSWWRWNHPDNLNVLRGNLKDLNEIPPCALLDAFVANLQTLDQTLHQTFVDGCRIRITERPATQKQDQKQKQKQEQRASAREELALGGAHGAHPLLESAREAKATSPAATTDELIETTLYIARNKRPDTRWFRNDAVQALSQMGVSA